MSAPRQGARKRYAQAASSSDPHSGGPSSSPPRSRSPKHKADPQADAAAAFRQYVARLMLSNKLSGRDTQGLASTSTQAMAQGVADLAKAGHGGSAPGNIHRDLMRSLKRGIRVPAPYFAEILARDPATNTNRVRVQLPFLLVHEMLAMLTEDNRDVLVKDLATLAEPFASLRADFCRGQKLDSSRMIGLGFHGDGVPHQRNKSVYVFSWNPINSPTSERVLFASVQREFLCQCGCKGRSPWMAF